MTKQRAIIGPLSCVCRCGDLQCDQSHVSAANEVPTSVHTKEGRPRRAQAFGHGPTQDARHGEKDHACTRCDESDSLSDDQHRFTSLSWPQ